jgi:hypothetical protein
MHHPVDSRQTPVSDLSNIILYQVAPSVKHSSLVVRVKQHNHSAIAAAIVLT